MELRAGYKQTEIGVIPKEWAVEIIDSISQRVGDGIHSTPIYSDNTDYYFVNGNNLINGKITINETTKMVSKEEFRNHKRDLNDSTILISINGTIGNLAFYNNEKIILGKSAAYINLSQRIEKLFLYQLLQTNFIKEYFANELTGSTIKNLGINSIRNTPIPLPPLPEQTAIATVLSDTDKLLQAIEKKIAKKRLIKQGVMQELLKPKERWVLKSLGEVCNNISSGSSNTMNEKGKYSLYGSTGTIGLKSYYDYSGKKILVARVGANAGNLYKVSGNYCVSDNTLMLSFSQEKNIDFYFFFLKLYNLNKLVFGSGQPLITGGQLKAINIPCPPTLEEQTQIATILSDMDTEIENLEKQLAKYKQVKQGLMQNLLTGKIRLV